jgi:type IV secretory pathway VirB9-like protein
MGRDRNKNRDRGWNRDKERDKERDKDPAEIYADGSDTPRKFVQKGMIPRSNVFRGV